MKYLLNLSFKLDKDLQGSIVLAPLTSIFITSYGRFGKNDHSENVFAVKTKRNGGREISLEISHNKNE